MTYARATVRDDPETLPRMPSWVTSARAQTPEDVAFLSGAALAHLHLVLGREEVPHALLRDRLALRAAEVCVALSGRPERAGGHCQLDVISLRGRDLCPSGGHFGGIARPEVESVGPGVAV